MFHDGGVFELFFEDSFEVMIEDTVSLDIMFFLSA
jgi:hypothetical protein